MLHTKKEEKMMAVFSNRKRSFRLLLAVACAVIISAGCGISALDSTTTGSQQELNSPATANPESVLENFKHPKYTDRPMARMWFPDAGAGIDEYDTIEKQIRALADGGFGGVEVTMLADGANFSNDEARIVGWGTEAWRKLLKKTLRAANAVDDGFTVDITVSPHWPLIINTVDPNDAAAAQEVSYASRKITAKDLSSQTLRLPMPKPRLEDETSAIPSAPFIFTDTFVSAALVRVASLNAGGTVTYDLDSIMDLTGATSEIAGEGYRAGVPDEAAAAQYGWDYQEILDLWGQEPAPDADLSRSFNGKMDARGNRARMQDWQHFYEADLSTVADRLKDHVPSPGDTIKPGDYVLVGVYRRGTGQVMSDGGFGGISVLMYGRTYTTDYFSRAGVDAVTHFWETNILDNELRDLLKENGASIFEDSIEASTTSSFWSSHLLDKFKAQNYGYLAELPLVVALGANSFDDAVMAGRIRKDFDNLLGGLYETDHLKPIRDWAATFNYMYRAQARGVTGVDEFSSATAVDIPEGDNGTKGDGLRRLAGSVRMADKAYLSMEAVTGFGNLIINWADVLTEVTHNFSHGVNHVILHGTPYSKAWNGYISDWPGWWAFGNNFAGSYTYRQIYWDDVATLSGYIARNQAVLRKGLAKIDLVVIGSGSGNSFQNLLDKGYAYHMASEALLRLDSATVSNGRLYQDGPGYKALIVAGSAPSAAAGPVAAGTGAETRLAPGEGDPDGAASFGASPAGDFSLTVESIRKLTEFAADGLPIILLNVNPTAVTGTETSENNDARMQALLERLKAADNVHVTASKDDVLSILGKLSITPDASYDQPALEATHYVDTGDGIDFYFLYNNPNPSNAGMMNAGASAKYKSAAVIDTPVTMTGNGVPYMLDAWTGDVTPIADYTVNEDGTVSTRVVLHGGESAIIAILPTGPGDTGNVHVVDAEGGETFYRDGEIVFRSNVAGEHTISMSDGSVRKVVVASSLPELDLSDAPWNLELLSFGPDYRESNIQGKIVQEFDTPYTIYKDPSASLITTVNFQGISLCGWQDLPATRAQLDELGVPSMKNVSGIGYYTTTFELPADWTETTGAILNFSYGQDEVTKVVVNGHTIEAVNVISDRVDIGPYLTPGKNSITIKLCSSLFNRALVDAMVFRLPGKQINGKNPVEYGLKAVTLTPYTWRCWR